MPRLVFLTLKSEINFLFDSKQLNLAFVLVKAPTPNSPSPPPPSQDLSPSLCQVIEEKKPEGKADTEGGKDKWGKDIREQMWGATE